jgi:hypothetical protein
MTKNHLNQVREALACLGEAAARIPLLERNGLQFTLRLQGAIDGLAGVREEIQVRLEAEEHANHLFTRGV